MVEEVKKPELKAKKSIKEQVYKLANQLMRENSFITLQSTKEILVYNENQGIYELGGEGVIERNVQSALKFDASIQTTNEVLWHIRRSTYVTHDEIDSSDNIINVRNGLLNIKTKKLTPHSPDYYSITQVPVNYIPDAKCTRIDNFIQSVFDTSDIEVVKEFIGYLLIKRYIFHKALMLNGVTGTGKTTFQRMLISFLGTDNVSTRTLQDLCENKFAKADLFGKLANISDDIPSNAVRYSGFFKQLTGESRITGERKFKDAFDFCNNAKVIFSCNELPSVMSDDDAYYYRWIIVETKHRFIGDQANRNLINELTTPVELSGLLNVALEYRQKLVDKNDFSYDVSVEYATRRYQLAVRDSVAKFIGHCVNLDGDSYVEKQQLYDTYVEWCAGEDIAWKPTNAFHRRLRDLLGGKVESYKPLVNGRQLSTYKGIKLKEEEL